MSTVPRWFERKFEFRFAVEHYPNVVVRLRGTPARLEEMLHGAAREKLVWRPEAQESNFAGQGARATQTSDSTGEGRADVHATHVADGANPESAGEGARADKSVRATHLMQWSAQEHAGHLLDLEPLWLARVEDFLRGMGSQSPHPVSQKTLDEDGESSRLTAADLSNRKTHEAKHNERALEEILRGFREARGELVRRVEDLRPEMFGRTMLHPRLKQEMRLVDHLYFVAEHDDHHLARMWEMIR